MVMVPRPGGESPPGRIQWTFQRNGSHVQAALECVTQLPLPGLRFGDWSHQIKLGLWLSTKRILIIRTAYQKVGSQGVWYPRWLTLKPLTVRARAAFRTSCPSGICHARSGGQSWSHPASAPAGMMELAWLPCREGYLFAS